MAKLTQKDLLSLSRLHYEISKIYLAAANNSGQAEEGIMVNPKLISAYKKITEIYESESIEEVSKVMSQPEIRNEDLEKEIAAILKKLCIPVHIKGYQYLKNAIALAVFDREILEKITKSLYPEVAKANKTTPSRVERAIRHAIEVAWSRNSSETVVEYFGNTIVSEKCKPTNSEFMAAVTDYICISRGI